MATGPTSAETRHLRTLFALGAAGSLTDGQLLERFATLDGDPAELAFAVLVERHGAMVFRVAWATLGDEHSAHDAFQATFLILARKARSLWVRDSLGPWLHAVAFRVANHSRSLEARRSRHERAASRPEAYDSRDWARDDLACAIHEEIERLPEPYRAAIVTCHLEGLTQQDAAQRLGWPVGTLQSRLARGRQRLRDRLKRRGLAPSLGALAGKLSPVPNALVASTAKAAATLHLGGAIAGMIAPAVLVMIQTTTKGMLMTKLKLGAMALVTVVGLVGSGMGLGVGRPVRATDDPKHAKPPAPLAPAEASLQVGSDESIPPAVEGARLPYLLEFYETETVAGLKNHQEVAKLARQGYPIKSFDVTLYTNGSLGRKVADLYEVHAYPEILLVDGAGNEIDRIGALLGPAEIAAFYDENWSKPAKKARGDAELARREGIPQDERAPAPPGLASPPIALPKTDEKPVSTDVVPRPVETAGFPILLYFQDSHAARQHLPNEIQWLIRLGYPIKMIDCDESPELVKRYGIFTLVTIVLVDGQGSPIAELKGNLRAQEIARFYNLNCLKSSATARRGDWQGKAATKGSGKVGEPALTPSREPVPPRTVSDQDRRVDELERKLDQVLKALEDLKGDRLWDQRNVHPPNLQRR